MADLLGLDERANAGARTDTVPVLLPLALDTTYDYLPPDGEHLEPGDFVLVPIGPRREVGR
jgi:primosomal protein N' (replication factor Y)